VARFFLLLLLVAASAWGRDPRFTIPDDLDTLFEPAWRRCFVRDVSTPVAFGRAGLTLDCARMMDAGHAFLDGRYLLNQADGMRFFYGWYLTDTELTYDGMLSMQHRLACLGITGKRVYVSWGGMGNSYTSDTRFPGLYRPEIVEQGYKPIDSDELELTLAEWKELGFDGEPSPRTYVPRMIGIRPEHRVSIRVLLVDGKPTLLRTAPQGEAETAYRDLSRGRMHRLRGLRDWTPVEAEANLEVLLNALADYYHAAINWMPFSSVNNSLFMGHVNVILKHLGLEPLPHGRLDYLALGSSTPRFRRIFRNRYHHR